MKAETHNARAQSLWAATAVGEPETVPLNGLIHCDTAIVGAGFTGLRAALALAEAGVSVTVLEAATIGWGASGRNGGQVNPLLPMHTPEQVVELIGPKAGERLAAAAMGSADELFELVKTHQMDCGARQNGWLRVAHSGNAARRFKRQVEAWTKAGADIEILTGGQLHDVVGSRAYQMGALIKRGGCIHPLSYARELATRAINAGARIHCSSPVIRLDREPRGWILRTEAGTVAARQVLVCTNGYTDHLVHGLEGSVLPLVSIQMASAPLPEAIAAKILPGGQTLSDTRRTIVYGRREPDGRFLIGSLGRADAPLSEADFTRLRGEACRLFPALKDAEWSYRWGGRIGVTQDYLPHLHEPAPGLMAGLGYNGRGVAMANVMGRTMAERVLGAHTEELAFPVTEITPMPWRNAKLKALPMAMNFMRMQDAFERVFR